MNGKKYIGVIGAGSFGTAISNLIAENHEVLLYARRLEAIDDILNSRKNLNQEVHERVTPTSDPKLVAENCELIFPTVPSAFFPEVLQKFSPYLTPEHILIHGTKGFYIELPEGQTIDGVKTIHRKNILTMSDLIMKETSVVRIGCISGPNLATELAAKLPAGTVIASPFDEVIEIGQQALRSIRFQVFSSHDMKGVELAGALKNIFAIASGALTGLQLGENARALLIAKGLGEAIRIGQILGAEVKSFVGLAGIGDIVATATSSYSRNYSVGVRLAQGEKLDDIIASSVEVAEGIHTVKVCKFLGDQYKVRMPITQALYRVMFENMPASKALEYLMKYPFLKDVDFM